MTTNPSKALRASTLPCLLAVALAASATAAPASEEKPASLGEALKQGVSKVALRYRFESVSEDGDASKANDASASTLRTALSYRSQPFKGLGMFLEAVNVAAAGNEDLYNNKGAGSLFNGVTDRPVVADPEMTQVAQAYVSLTGKQTDFRAGRQEVLLGNHRFVGNVGWRQTRQSYDSFGVTNSAIKSTKLSYHYIDRVHRIFGDRKELNAHLFHGEVAPREAARVSFYGYLLDYERPEDTAFSTSTFGLRLDGTPQVGSRGKITYAFEYADQSEHGDNKAHIDVAYYLAELGGGIKPFSVRAGLEVLEGSPEQGKFTTPLATLHKFNGWGDKFLATPSNGLEDLYVAFEGKTGRIKWATIFHDFTANNGSLDYGSELDLLASYTTTWGQVFGLKAALYDAATHSMDTDKIWFWTSYSFDR